MQIAVRGPEGPAEHGGNIAGAVDGWHRREERRVDDAALLATCRGTQPRAQLIERRAQRDERAERVGGKLRVEHAVVEWDGAGRMRLPSLSVGPRIREQLATIRRIASAAEPEVRAGVDDAAVLVQATADHGRIGKQLEETDGIERPAVVHDPGVVPQNVQQAAALGRSRRNACQPRHAVRRIQMDDLVRNLLRHLEARWTVQRRCQNHGRNRARGRRVAANPPVRHTDEARRAFHAKSSGRRQRLEHLRQDPALRVVHEGLCLGVSSGRRRLVNAPAVQHFGDVQRCMPGGEKPGEGVPVVTALGPRVGVGAELQRQLAVDGAKMRRVARVREEDGIECRLEIGLS